jgi:CSLREA domain-containing protein
MEYKAPSFNKLILLLFFWWIALVSVASSETFVVTKSDDTDDQVCDSDCSIREAIFAANSTISGNSAVGQKFRFGRGGAIVEGIR